MNKRLTTGIYVIADVVVAIISWLAFFYFRKEYIEESEFTVDDNLIRGLVILPFFWMFLFFIAGSYRDVFRRYRIKELGQTILISLIGTLLLFFILLLDDTVQSYKNYYQSFFVLFGLHCSLSLLFRLAITGNTVRKIHSRTFGFKTLIIGGSQKALELYEELESQAEGQGFDFVGFVSLNGVDQTLKGKLNYIGKLDIVKSFIDDNNIEEAVIAIESSEHDQLQRILTVINGADVRIKIIPDMYDILSGSVKMTSILGAPLIEVNPEIMPQWQRSTKRVIDISFSLLALTLLMPVYIFTAIGVKLSSSGPIFFFQERVGLRGKKFNIIKFRSMTKDAEKSGPQLSSDNDMRITKFGKFMRKTRLDELPQFFNVLRGEMSIVGPRPERQFFIDQIVEKAPHYTRLHKVKPGITSWGQVKFGYAENVDEMIERLKYDLLYLENMSLAVDFKIMIYTVRTILRGSGK